MHDTDFVTISTNGRSRIRVDEVQEHLMIPEYPHTKEGDIGIVHFIHCENPILRSTYDLDESSLNKRLCEIFTEVTSHVGSDHYTLFL